MDEDQWLPIPLRKPRSRSSPGLFDANQRSSETGSQPQSTRDDEDKINRLFNKLDKTFGRDRGRIPTREVIKSMNTMTMLSRNGLHHEIERKVMEADRDRDGFIVREEFNQLFSTFSTAAPQMSSGATNNPANPESLHMEQMEIDEADAHENVIMGKLHKYLTAAAYADQYNCFPLPWFMILITLVQILTFANHWFHFRTHPGHKESNLSLGWHGPYQICSRLIFQPDRRYEWYRYLTYVLVHAGGEHLVSNVLLQLVGILLEMSHGSKVVGLIYVSGTLAGSLSTSILYPTIRLAGASPAAYALIGGHLASIALNWNEDRCVVSPKMTALPENKVHKGQIYRYARLIIMILVPLHDFLRFCFDHHHKSDANRGGYMVYTSHLCGSMVGFLVGMLSVKNKVKETWEMKCQWFCALLLLLLITCAFGWSLVGNEVTQAVLGPSHKYFMPENYQDRNGHNGDCNYSSVLRAH